MKTRVQKSQIFMKKTNWYWKIISWKSSSPIKLLFKENDINTIFIELSKVEKEDWWAPTHEIRWLNIPKYRKDKANLIIEEYVEKHKHTYFTIDQIKNHFTSILPWNEIPSWEYIRKYMRNWLNLSFKRVSCRPKKNSNRDLLIKGLTYTHLIETIDQEGYILVQIDEFSIGRNIFPSMVWTEKGWSGYELNDTIQNRWSVIDAISNFSFEAVAISKNNTNGTVFVEFLELLIENLKIRFWDKINKIVLSADGARCHNVKEVDAILKKNKMMLIQTIPYTPEFSPIEIFINWEKSKIRKKIRNGK